MRDAEHRIQCACVRWFRYQYPTLAFLLFAIPNGGQRSARTGSRLKDEGVLAGVADMFLSHPGADGSHGLYIEMKAGKNGQTDTQKAFQHSVTAAGYRYEVCRSLEEFSDAVCRHLNKA